MRIKFQTMISHFFFRKVFSFCISGALIVLPFNAQSQNESIYQQFAPIELTGTWVSVVTEDWHMRMVTPPVGNFDGLPLTERAQETARSVDLEQIENSGQACQAYGAGRIMREPGRLRISWADGDTLRIDTDAGEQTRLLHFDNIPASGTPSLQGHSIAQWQYAGGFDPERALLNPGQVGSGFTQQPAPVLEPAGGKLYVETSHLSPGMLRKNGVPYSEETSIKEYFNTLTEPDGTEWLIVTTIVRDPVNLLVEYITSSNFQREVDDSKWNPRPCSLF
jgi:hypothetical protein